MRIHDSIDEFFPPESGLVVLIGKADALHLGHIALINETIHLAQQIDSESGIMSLIPDPGNPVFIKNALSFVLTPDERNSLLANWPLDHIIYQLMNDTFTDLTAEKFITSVLHEKLHAEGIVVGWDFRFGKNQTGNVDLLKRFSTELDYVLKIIDPVMINDKPVKTTHIRELIEKGEFSSAQNFLGYPFFVTGKVVKGKGLGRKLGFPTANMDIPTGKLLPGNGVSIVRGHVDKKVYWGLVNTGRRPTVHDESPIVTEVWLRKFSGNILGKNLKIEFFKFLRDEIKFPTLDELKTQMQKDAVELEEYLAAIHQD